MKPAINVTKSMRTITVLICLLAPTAVAVADENPNALSAWNKKTYSILQKILIRAAEKTPEEYYSFKPTEVVRSLGQILGHIADANYAMCSAVRGEKNPALKIEQTKTSKADLIAGMKDAFAYCDKAYVGMTDASAAETVKFFGGDTPKLGVLTVNQMHTMEHYGNLVTYMRMKDIVPPSSDPEFMKTVAN